jgi:hypothetical protein
MGLVSDSRYLCLTVKGGWWRMVCRIIPEGSNGSVENKHRPANGGGKDRV